ncbi:hypothetical protein [Gluconacetobacter tumulisoli]|uniref:Uncharacterized protein n=1 Tax=Gluconacetobacter tumulisoli TaxID=1286189 RepID=A0A7W4K9C7_9PROT|nr:hypothetical protein [Gluconacetobacter tumulisoli]MBB2202756.1 hypothetical protein [Gluconacetobacter tumulisoli]
MISAWACYRAALRNYASRAFIIGNPNVYSALAFLVLTPGWIERVAPGLGHGTTDALDHAEFNPLFMAALMGMASIGTYYWRQVGDAIAVTIPGFLAAELHAGLSVVGLLFVLLTIPLLWCGLPAAGSAAFVAASFTFGAGIRPVRGQKPWEKSLRVLLVAGGLLLIFMPRWQVWLLFLPWPLAGGVVALSGALVVLSMTHHVGRTQAEHERAESLADARPIATARPGRARAMFRRLLLWQPARLRQAPLPPTLSRPIGPLGILLSALVSVAVMLILSAVMAAVLSMVNGEAFDRLFLHAARTNLLTLPSLALMGLNNWLMNRKDWPFFFMAGRYGGRLAFARAMFGAYLVNAILTGVGIVAPVMLFEVLLGSVPAAAGGWLGLLLVLMFVGACHGSSVPLLWREQGGKGVTVMAGIAAYMTMALANPVALYRDDHAGAAIVTALSIFVAGLAVSRLAPRQLARMDWPFDGE